MECSDSEGGDAFEAAAGEADILLAIGISDGAAAATGGLARRAAGVPVFVAFDCAPQLQALVSLKVLCGRRSLAGNGGFRTWALTPEHCFRACGLKPEQCFTTWTLIPKLCFRTWATKNEAQGPRRLSSVSGHKALQQPQWPLSASCTGSGYRREHRVCMGWGFEARESPTRPAVHWGGI